MYQVVLPVLSTGASLLAISTIAPESDNMLKQLVNAKNSRGLPIIRTINLEMVCERCKRRGRELKCTHMLGMIPSWQSRGRHSDIQAMMATQEDTFLVEMRGIESDQFTKPAFDIAGMRDFGTKYHTHDGSDIRHIFIGVDPAAGGAKSDYAIVSGYYTGTRSGKGEASQLVICGAEFGNYKENTECASLLINHMMAVRRNVPGAEHARIVFIPESNLAFEALWATDEIRRSGIRDICVMKEDANRAGIKTNRELKEVMALAFNRRLIKRRVHLLDKFVCIGDNTTPWETRDKLVMEFRNYSRIVRPPRDGRSGAQPAVFYSGKNGYGFDDMCIALQLLNVMHKTFFDKTDMYGDWH